MLNLPSGGEGGTACRLRNSCYEGLEQSCLWTRFQEFTLISTHPAFPGYCFSLINLALFPLPEYREGSAASVADGLGDRQLL